MNNVNIIATDVAQEKEDIMAKRFIGGELVSSVAPAGSVTAFAGESAPDGWLVCDGSPISRSEYPQLFAALGVIYGNGDGSTTFNLPDYRGQFLRGRDASAGNDPDAASRTDRGDGQSGDKVGSKQDDALQGHEHDIKGRVRNTASAAAYDMKGLNAGGTYHVSKTDGITESNAGTPRTSNETRPKNISVNYIIKY
jgi:microcystin-dependent protein